jgi:hypothetical protein
MGPRLRKKKKEKKKKKSRVSSTWANIDAYIPIVSNIKTARRPKKKKNKKKAAKNNYVAKKCKPFLGVLVSTSMFASVACYWAKRGRARSSALQFFLLMFSQLISSVL